MTPLAERIESTAPNVSSYSALLALLGVFPIFFEEYAGAELPLIAITATGGATSLGSMLMVPGASKVLHSVVMPYAFSASACFSGCPPETLEPDVKSVGSEIVGRFLRQSIARSREAVAAVAISGAILTNRYRRGPNEAYIALAGKMLHVTFKHHTTEEYDDLVRAGGVQQVRTEQDVALSLLVLNELLGFDYRSPNVLTSPSFAFPSDMSVIQL